MGLTDRILLRIDAQTQQARAELRGVRRDIDQTAASAARANDKAAVTSRRASAETAGLRKEQSRLAAGLKTSAGLIGAYGGARALGLLISESQEARKVTAQTNAVLKSTGGVSKVTRAEIEKLSAAMSRKAGVDDETVQQSENLLLTFTKVRNEAGKGNQVFTRGAQAALDLSAALGTDLNSATIQVGKALNDPIKGVTALQRVGVSFTAQQREQIKALMESGHQLDAQKLILRELNTEFGGTAAAKATPLDRLQVSALNLAETLGTELAPAMDEGARQATRFIDNIERDWPQIRKEISDTVEPAVDVAGAMVSLVRSNPELAKTAASMAIIGGGAVKLSKMTGAGSLVKLAFQRGNSPATPMYVADVTGGGTGGAPIPGRGRRGLDAARRLAPYAGLALGADAAYNAAQGKNRNLEGTAAGALMGSRLGPLGALAGAAAGGISANLIAQNALKAADKKSLGEVYQALKISTREAQVFKTAMSQAGGSLESIKTRKLVDLRDALGLVSFASRDAQRKAGDLADAVSRELGERMVRSVDRAWDKAGSKTDVSIADIRRTVQRNMPLVRQAMRTHSDAGADAIVANFDRARDAIVEAMRDGRVSVSTGLAEIRSQLKTEIAHLGVQVVWGTAAPSNPDDLPGPGAPLPKPSKPTGGSKYVLAPQRPAGGGWIGMPGQAGRDEVPALLGAGEAVLNRHQQIPVESALRAQYGIGLDELFQRERRPHYLASGGRIGAVRYHGPGGVLGQIGQATLDRARASADAALSRVTAEAAPQLPGMGDTGGLHPQVVRAIAYARRHGWDGRVTSGRRSYAEQAALYARRASNPYPVAAPGTSMHETGQAIDVTDPDGFRRAMASAPAGSRLLWFGPGDRVHFSITGRARGGWARQAARFAQGGKVGYARLEGLWRAAGGSQRAQAIAAAVAMAESGGDPRALGRNQDGSVDRGLWQINSVHGALSVFDQVANAKAAVKISKDGTYWKPWTVYRTGAYRRFMRSGVPADMPEGTKSSGESAAKRRAASLRARRHQQGVLKDQAGTRRAVNESRAVRIEDAYDRRYQAALLTPSTADDLRMAQQGYDYWSVKARQYQHGYARGDKRITADLLANVVSTMETWQERAGLKPKSFNEALDEQIAPLLDEFLRAQVNTPDDIGDDRSVAGRLVGSLQASWDAIKDLPGRADDRSYVGGLLGQWRGTLKDLQGQKTPDEEAQAQRTAEIARTLRAQNVLLGQQLDAFRTFAPLAGMRYVGAFARGGKVPRTGLALLHEGEVVTPSPQGPFRQSPVAAAQPVTVHLRLEGDAGQLVRLVDARVDDRAARVVSEQLGRRQRALTIAPGGIR